MPQDAETSLIIAAVPERSDDYLERAVASAESQTRPFSAIHIEWDGDPGTPERRGPAAVRNRALQRVKTEFCAVLDDDDVLLPEHNEILSGALERAGEHVYLVHGACAMFQNGRMLPAPEAWRQRWSVPFSADALERTNWIPVTTVFWAEALQELGGYHTRNSSAEDYSMLLHLVRTMGPRSIAGPGDGIGIPDEPTWLYCLDSSSAMWEGRRRPKPGPIR